MAIPPPYSPGHRLISQVIPEAYERLLQDALEGDATLFIRGDHIEEAWRIIDPVLGAWENGASPLTPSYEPGTWGPEDADEFIARDERRWLQVCGVHGEGHA